MKSNKTVRKLIENEKKDVNSILEVLVLKSKKDRIVVEKTVDKFDEITDEKILNGIVKSERRMIYDGIKCLIVGFEKGSDQNK